MLTVEKIGVWKVGNSVKSQVALNTKYLFGKGYPSVGKEGQNYDILSHLQELGNSTKAKQFSASGNYDEVSKNKVTMDSLLIKIPTPF